MSSLRWNVTRAKQKCYGQLTVNVPCVADLLISKLKRGEPRDKLQAQWASQLPWFLGASILFTKILLDLSMAVCFGKTHRCAKECSRTGAIPSIHTITGSWRIKKPLKRCLVHSPAMKNWIEICEKETSAFGLLSEKSHPHLPIFKKYFIIRCICDPFQHVRFSDHMSGNRLVSPRHAGVALD